MDSDRRVLLATCLYHLTNDGSTIVVAGEITVLRDRLGFDYGGVGLLTAVALVATVVSQLAFGWMSDRRDPARFLTLGIAFLGVMWIAVAAAWAFLPFLILVALARIGSGFYHPVGISWVGQAYAGPTLDRAMGFQSAFGDMGEILGLGTAAVLGAALWWQAPFLLWGGLCLAAVGVGAFALRGRPGPSPVDPVRVPFRSVLLDVRYWLLPIAVGGATFNVVASFGPVLVHDVFHQSDAMSGIAIAVWVLIGTVASFSFGRLSARFGRYRSLLAAFLLLAAANAATGTLGVAPALIALWTMGSALFITYPALFSFVSEASRRRVQGATFGVIFGFQLVGGAAAVYASGLLAQATGSPATPFLLVAVLCGATAVYLAAVRPRADTGERAPALAAPQV